VQVGDDRDSSYLASNGLFRIVCGLALRPVTLTTAYTSSSPYVLKRYDNMLIKTAAGDAYVKLPTPDRCTAGQVVVIANYSASGWITVVPNKDSSPYTYLYAEGSAVDSYHIDKGNRFGLLTCTEAGSTRSVWHIFKQ